MPLTNGQRHWRREAIRREFRHSHKSGWLSAAVLGANDGGISTASLVLGVASAHTNHAGILLAGGAGIVSGAMAMAVTAGVGALVGTPV